MILIITCCVSVFPVFEMSHRGFTIDGQKQPEGYITDYPISTVHGTSGNTPKDIIIEMNNLPVSAFVYFKLEEINMAASTNPGFIIGTRSRFLGTDDIYVGNSSTMGNQTQFVKIAGNNSIVVTYQSKKLSLPGEYVRLKYKGR